MIEKRGRGVKLSFEKVSRGAPPDTIALQFDEERRILVPLELDSYVRVFGPGEELTTSQVIERLGRDPTDERERRRVLDALRNRSRPNGPLLKVRDGRRGSDAVWKRRTG